MCYPPKIFCPNNFPPPPIKFLTPPPSFFEYIASQNSIPISYLILAMASWLQTGLFGCLTQ